MKYEYKCNVYNYVGVGKFKDSTGKWIDAIIYERDNHIYMREITDFIDKFKKVLVQPGLQPRLFLLFGRKKKIFFLQFKNYNEYTETRNSII